MSSLTTHILDLTHGTPAHNVEIHLSRVINNQITPLAVAVTNEDGRLSEPLLSEKDMKKGEYELLFHIGDYFRKKEIQDKDPRFLDKVSVRFGISDSSSHYHVPLLVSPWGYQVYRGS
ncbi:hydroxyisourate hydrolase [Thalassobacillus sp. C254]|uniref:hydroxyisourate hydrolase n=1 Tax=Thalassobacillus sp. C254 TaxID=1225341 RepID=UPI0006D21E85|nr:hydroxyisourate hydrolase [Thalassobacillus sp. C254]